MNLSYLQSYMAVIKTGSFSGGAQSLQVSKGLISRHVKHLESQLGVKLLHRTTRVIRMSEAGEILYLQAQKIFSLANEVEREICDANQDASGLLRFTAPISIGDRIIKDLLGEYKLRCPNVSLELNFTNSALDIASGENDIALRAFETLPELAVAISLGRICNVLVASPCYIKSRSKIEKLEDLADHNCILNSHQQDWNVWQFYKMPAAQKVNSIVVTGNLATSKYTSAKLLAIQGHGLANLPWYSVQDAVKNLELELVLPNYQLFVHEIAVVHAQQRQLPKKLSVFKQLIVDWFTENSEYTHKI
jgi:DNA-binding transcriptional LysR family regulator